jgi:ATP-binding cassette subfamily B protein
MSKEDSNVRLQDLSSLKFLMYFIKEKKPKMIMSIFLAILGEIVGLVPYYVVSQIIFKLYENSLEVTSLYKLVFLVIASHALKFALTWKSTMLSHETAFGILKNIRLDLTQKMMKIPMGDVLNRSIGEWKNLIVDQVSKLEDSLAHIIPEMTANIIAPLVIIVYLFTINWKMGVISMLTIPMGMLCYLGVIPGYKKKMQRYTDSSNEMNANLVEYINGIEVIKAFSKEGSSYKKFSDSVIYFHDTTMEWWKSCWFFNSAAKAIMPSTLLTTLPAGAYLLMSGELEINSFILCIVLPIAFVGPMLKLAVFTDEFSFINASTSFIGEFLDQEEMISGKENVDDLSGGFNFENVEFSYEDKPVLKDVSFIAKSGEMTAIVGPSGSGKSTIAKLMAGFWQPNKGKVTYADKDMRALNADSFVKHMSYVAQDNFLFNKSILENLKIANPSASKDDVERACKISNCHDFIISLPNGYETMVGDAGGLLSGGERQRITLARAILKDAPTIILDEATAYADPETDYLIQESINKMVRGKTMVVVAHRLSTIVNADQILVVDGGRIVQSGSHKELMKSCSLYQNMWSEYENMQREVS